MTYHVKPISDLAGAAATVSTVTDAIAPEHARFLGDTPYANHDVRQAGRFDFGDVAEPGLAETWAGFEATYQSIDRYADFWACELEDAVIHPPFGIVSIGDVIVRETVRDSKMLASTFPGLDRVEARRGMKNASHALAVTADAPEFELTEPCFQLGWGLSENYFNWTLRYLSKIPLWQRGASDQRLVVPAPTHGFIDRGLEFFGVPQGAVHHLAGRTRVRRLTLTAPSAVGRYDLSPMLTAALRRHSRVEAIWEGKRSPVYVMRGQSDLRQVVNETEVMDHLRARGFRMVDPGKLPMAEQIRSFRDASLVLAPHGAGLANIVYCRPGTPVIEFVPEGYDQGITSYRSLADLFGLRYVQFFGREVVPNRRGNRCNSHIAIALPSLDRALDAVAA